MFSKLSNGPINRAPDSGKHEKVWNALTLVVLLVLLAAVVVMLVIFSNPNSRFNPFPPPDLPGKLILPTSAATATSDQVVIPTVTPTLEVTDTVVVLPTILPSLDPTPTTQVMVVPGTPSAVQPTQPVAEEEDNGRFVFGLQAPPQGLSVTLYDPNRGCSWMGVAGRIFDIQNRPVKGIRVAVTGFLGGKQIQYLSLSGTAVQYGPSGYEFTLAETPIASSGRLTIQLFDQSDLPLSPPVTFDTFAECESNLVLVDFKQVNE